MRIALVILVALLACSPLARAQQPAGGANSIGPSVQGGNSISLTSHTFATLPATCIAKEIAYCSDCKSVADGVTASSTAIGSGNGALVVCKSGNTWKVAP